MVHARLIIFTRYPLPGQTKTRLVPGVGDRGAAWIQRWMTERTIETARSWQGQAWAQKVMHVCPVPEFPGLPQKLPNQAPNQAPKPNKSLQKLPDRYEVEVWFTGGSIGKMRHWLDRRSRLGVMEQVDDNLRNTSQACHSQDQNSQDRNSQNYQTFSPLRFVPQGAGDLGDRLTRAIRKAQADGVRSVVVIGTDCPALDVEILCQAFHALQNQDAVIGAARDGGYYLLGFAIDRLHKAISPKTVSPKAISPNVAQSLFDRLLHDVFQGIPWSTDRVYDLTEQALRVGGCAIAYLPTLTDIDQPSDLPALLDLIHAPIADHPPPQASVESVKLLAQASISPAVKSFPPPIALTQDTPRPQLSVIIPTYNEATQIQATLNHLFTTMTRTVAQQGIPRSNSTAQIQPATSIEVIISDGNSSDQTIAIATTTAQALGVSAIVKTLTTSSGGRAAQCNAAAAIAQGQTLLFLHADTRLPPCWDLLIGLALHRPHASAKKAAGQAAPSPWLGAFELQTDSDRPVMRWVETWANRRSRWLSLPYGDQGLFCRAADFWAIGGFPKLPIMDDYALVRAFARAGSVVTLPIAVQTSARRWQRLGVWRTTVLNQAIVVAYELGMSPDRLARWYRNQR